MTAFKDSFKEDLEIGRIAEEYILKRIKRKYPKAKIMEGYFKEYDIIIPEINQSVEVKQDKKSLYTGNYVVEVSFNGKPSALSTTTADWWVFYDGECEVWIKPDYIWKAVKGLPIREFVGNGDSKSKNAYLCPKEYIRIQANKIREVNDERTDGKTIS